MYHNKTAINVLIGDDQEVYRSGLKTIFRNAPQKNILVIGEVNNGTDLLQSVRQLHPDVVITNVSMPLMNCIEVCTQIKTNFTHTGLITYSSQENHSLIYELFDIGINAHLSKKTQKKEIIEAVNSASKGNMFYSSNISNALIKNLSSNKRWNSTNQAISFTKQELAIINLICKQLTSKEIASELHLASRTIEDHSKRIKEKAGVVNIVGIALYAIKKGIVKLEDL